MNSILRSLRDVVMGAIHLILLSVHWVCRCSAGRMVEGVYEAQGQHETRLCLKWDNR